MMTLKVKNNSTVKSVAGAIAGEIKKNGEVQVSAVGPNAVNQAIKAIACANSFALEDNYSIVCTPEFKMVEIDGNDRTSILFTVKKG